MHRKKRCRTRWSGTGCLDAMVDDRPSAAIPLLHRNPFPPTPPPPHTKPAHRHRPHPRAPLALLTLVFLLIACRNIHPSLAALQDGSFGFGRWYYESLELDKTGFYVGKPFRAVYRSPASAITWSYPSTCTFAALTPLATPNDTVQFTCTVRGPNFFSVYANNAPALTDSFYVTIDPPPGCYQWYFVAAPVNTSKEIDTVASDSLGALEPGSRATARLWIVDPAHLSAVEAAKTARVPGDTSKQLTLSLETLGDVPLFSFPTLHALTNLSLSFDTAISAWHLLFTTPTSGGLVELSLSSRGTAVLGCRVADTVVDVPIAAYATAEAIGFPRAPVQTLTPPVPAFDIVTDPCAATLQVALLGGTRFLFSHRSLGTSVTPIYTLPALPGLPSPTSLQFAAPNPRGIALLVDGAVFFTPDTIFFVRATGIPTGVTITALRGAPACDDSQGPLGNVYNSAILAWSAGSTTLYYSFDGGASFANSTAALADTTLVASSIADAATLHVQQRVVVLVATATGKHAVAMLDPATTRWSDGHVFALGEVLGSGKPGAVAKMAGIASGSVEVMVWGAGLFYSPNGGLSFFSIPLVSRDPFRPAVQLDAAEYVRDMDTSEAGAWIAITSTNRLFHGKTGLSDVVEIAGGLVPSDVISLEFDYYDRARITTPVTASAPPYVSVRYLPLSNEVRSPRPPLALNPPETCPYTGMSGNLEHQYIIDVDENFNFSVSITPQAGFSNAISVTFSNVSLLDMMYSETTTVSLQASSSSIVTRTRTVLITSQSYNRTGKSDIRVIPHAANLACTEGQQVSSVMVGCHPGRHLRYRYSSAHSYDCATAPASITYPKGSYIADWLTGATGTGDLVVPYNCASWGTPISAYYASSFRPTFDVYDGTTFVKSVDADLVIHEMYGREPYSYNTTVGGAGCFKQPQTWEKVTAQRPYPYPFDVWSAQNYEPCYLNAGFGNLSNLDTLTDTSAEYEIINGTNFNALHWLGGSDVYLIFQAKVVDPTFSYCTLQTTFVVHVYGAPLTIGLQLGIVFGLIAGVFLVLAVSYRFYRKLHVNEFAKIKPE